MSDPPYPTGASLHAADASGETPLSLIRGSKDMGFARKLNRRVAAENERRGGGAGGPAGGAAGGAVREEL